MVKKTIIVIQPILEPFGGRGLKSVIGVFLYLTYAILDLFFCSFYAN
jgi:hypothetical protein